MKRFQHIFLCMILGFILGTSNGYITLWKENSSVPLKVFPYQASMLPPADQQALEKGIYISGQQQLLQLLEDYLS